MKLNAQPQAPRALDPAYRMVIAVARRTPLSRGGFRRAILNFIKARVDHPIITDFRGVPFILNLDNTTEAKALFGYYNIDELNFLNAGLPDTGAVFVDMGANSGFFTQNFLARTKGTGHALAIEPNPKMCARIRANYEILQAQSKTGVSKLSFEQCAVGDVSAVMELDLSTGYGGAHVTDEKSAHSITVQVEPFETLLRRNSIEKIDVMKVDVEGFEDRALIPFFKNAPQSLFPKHIIIEHTSQDQWVGDLFGVMKDAGYRTVKTTRGNMFLSR